MPRISELKCFVYRTNGNKPRLLCLFAGLLLVISFAADSFAQKRRRHKPARKPRPMLKVRTVPTAGQTKPASGSKPIPQPQPTPVPVTCLPEGVKGEEIAAYGLNGAKDLTVADQLKNLKARCQDGKLVGPDGREIRFFRLACWGYPPPNYRELQSEQNRKLEELKASYTVIVINCDPRIP